MTLRNGNNSGETSDSQILFTWNGNPYNSAGFSHKIQSRHTSGTTHNENAIDFYLWKNGQGNGDIGNTHGMSITAAGVGIGTTSPIGQFQVATTSGNLDAVFSAATNSDCRLVLQRNHGGNSSSIGGSYNTIGDTYYVDWLIDNNSNNSTIGLKFTSKYKTYPGGVATTNDVMFLHYEGNVGIGTTSPSYKLDVNGTGRFAGNLTIGGNLTINGTTTTVNSTTMTVDDPIITLGGDTAPGSNDNKDRGVEFRYYDGSAKVGFMGWDDSDGSFVVLKDATNSSEVFSGTAAELKVGSLTIGSDTVSNLSSLLTTSSSLSSLSNVSTTAPSNNQVLTWNGSAWAPADASGGGGGASALNDLSDVSTSGAQTNYALVYNGSSWAPAAQSGSGTAITGDDFSPSGATLINENGTTHARDRGDLGNLIDGNTGTSSYISSSSTVASHGPFITALDIPYSKVGQELHKVIINKSGDDDYGTLSFKVGYRRNSTNYSLNVSSVNMSTSTGTVQTGTVIFSNDSDWHVTGVSGATIFTINLSHRITLQTDDKILIRWLNTGTNKHFLTNEITLNGSYANETVNLTTTVSPLWEELSVTGGPPGIRYDPAAVTYNNKLIVSGGANSPQNNTWELNLDSKVWSEKTSLTTTTPDYARHVNAIRYGNKMFVWGGVASGNVRKLWQLNLDTYQWTDVTPTGMVHPNRYYGVALWNSKLIYFGGHDDFTSVSTQNVVTEVDVSGSTYTRIVKIANGTSGSPPGRYLMATGVYEDNLYMFGGYTGSYVNDLWELDLLSYSWTQKTYTGSPPVRSSHRMLVYNDRIYIFGGGNSTTSHLNDLWELNLTTFVFSSISTSTSPSPRYGFGFGFYDNAMYIFGGAISGTRENDTWKLVLPQYRSAALGDLSNVTTEGALENYALVYNGYSWAPASTATSTVWANDEWLSYNHYLLESSTDSGENFNNDYLLQHFFDGSTGGVGGHSNNIYNASGDYTGSSTTNGYSGVWVQQQYSEEVYVTKLRMFPRGTDTSFHFSFPREMKVFGSHDGSTWIEIEEILSSITDFGTNSWTTKKVSSTRGYKYIRIVFHKTFSFTGVHGVNFAELQIIGRREGHVADNVKSTVSANVVHQRMTEPKTLTASASGGKVEIEDLGLTITPQSSFSKLEIDYSIFYEPDQINQGFVVFKNGRRNGNQFNKSFE